MATNGNGVRYSTREMFERLQADIAALREDVSELRRKVDTATGIGLALRWLVVPVVVSVTAALLTTTVLTR